MDLNSNPNHSRRILIVDDEAAIRKMLTIAFIKAGYDVLTAANVLQAMNVLATEKVDAVLSDVLMNSLSGHHLVRWVAAYHPSVPCVLMSDFDDRDCDDCPFASGCVQLRMPLNPNDAIGAVAQAIRTSRG
jgi:DNA-binding NtrC family response regulator